MRTNQYLKFLKGEDALHVACCEYLELQYPHIEFFHTPNEGKRTHFEQYKAKMLRIKSGVPDLMMFDYASTCAVELKYEDNTPTPNQIGWLAKLRERGVSSYVCWSFDAFKEIVDFQLSADAQRLIIAYVTTPHGHYVVNDNDKLIPKKVRKLITKPT